MSSNIAIPLWDSLVRSRWSGCLLFSAVEAGAVRELEEETNLICVTTDLRYLGEPSSRKYYFLTQKWHRRVNISQPNPNTGEIEHDDYKWATVEEIKEIDNTEIPIYLLEKALTMAQNAK